MTPDDTDDTELAQDGPLAGGTRIDAIDDPDEQLDALGRRLDRVREEVGKRLVGQEEVLDQLLVTLLCDGNALLESNPGLGKTMTIRTLSEVIDLGFSRIQNTPDLMPSDITGTEIIREGEAGREFVFERGPVFSNVVLADEINRATPKTQAALLEAMEEKQVTAAGETYELPKPFFLLATQNPIDQEGTYPLPEAQADRFLLKVLLDYPGRGSELEIVDRYTTRHGDDRIPVERVLASEELHEAQRLTRQVPIADDIQERAVDLVRETREAERLEYGASPRASMALVVAAKAHALLEERAYVSESDVETMAVPVLRHRVVVGFRAEREGVTPDDVIADLV
jgi:MoxR-like ATPase